MSFSGRATDEQDGSLAGSRLRWSLIIHHCPSTGSCHTHPRQDFRGPSGAFVTPDDEHARPSWLELRLTATDSRGLTDTDRVRLER